MSDELQGISKYQRKQLAKARGQWVAPSERIEVAVSVKVDPPPEASNRDHFADVGKMGEDGAVRRLHTLLEHAAATLRIAHRIAARLNRDVTSGPARSHVNAIMGRTAALSQKIEGLTSHATKIAKTLGSNA